MREILFRGKTYDDEWVEGSLHIEYSEATKDGKRKTDYRILGMRGECRYIFPETIGQYTGLTDKNGKKIFEGDIVCLRTSRHHEIKYIDGSFIIDGTSIPIKYANKFEVIGNIHDNPELIKGVKK